MLGANTERDRLRGLFDEFEARCRLPSERLLEPFMVDGVQNEIAESHAWDNAYADRGSWPTTRLLTAIDEGGPNPVRVHLCIRTQQTS